MIHGTGIHGIQVTGTILQFIVTIQPTGIQIIITAGGILIRTMEDTIHQTTSTEQMMDTKSEIIQGSEMDREAETAVEETEIYLLPVMELQL